MLIKFSKIQNGLLFAVLVLSTVTHAQLKEISDTPLANVSSTTLVKPNILFVMDDSGSMAFDYSPDYVDDPNTSLQPPYTAKLGDPPYMSAQYNLQYYNPRIHYLPPVGYDGSAKQGTLSFPSQTRSQTENWTKVRTDGFNVYNRNQISSNSLTLFNLASAYPDRVYCTSATDDVDSASLCKINDPGFLYAHGHSNLATGLYSVGESSSNTPRYRLGGPYYYNILPWEYCSDVELTDCIRVTPGTAAPGGYPFEARVRWCSSAANTMKTNTTASECRGRRDSSFKHPRFSPQANTSVAYGLITVNGNWCSGTANSNACNAHTVTLPEITIGGTTAGGVAVTPTTIIGSIKPSYQGTSSTRHEIMARAITAAINQHTGSPEYIACVGGTTPDTNAPRCDQAPFAQFNFGASANTVVVIAVNTLGGDVSNAITDASRAGLNIEVTPNTATGTRPAWARIQVSESGNGTGNIASVRVGPPGGPYTEILSGPLASNFTSSMSGNNTQKSNARIAAAKAICNRINALSATTGFRANTAANSAISTSGVPSNPTTVDSLSVVSTDCSSNNAFVTIIGPTAQGAAINGWEILTTPTGTNTMILPVVPQSNTNTLFRAGYTTPVVATTSGSISAGSLPVSAFQRVNIVPARATYPKDPARTDCITTAGVCTYDEEMTNFANWYAYYRTRNQMMKSAAGHAFLTLSENYRLGYNSINNSTFGTSETGSTKWLPVLDLTSTHKSRFYNKLYANNASSSTPLRGALTRAGQYFAGTLTSTNSPIQYSCQRNYTILTTDGYWNEDYSSTVIGDADNVNDPAQFCTRANGCYDGGITSHIRTLSDVATYYYRTDLRTDMVNNVPVTPDDPNPAQHMTTFTLGLGVDGLMRYRKDYDTATEGDFYKIRTGATGCEWQNASEVCNWPIPINNSEPAVDDLWHAAVSGHGRYFSAKDPTSLAEGLAGTLNALQIKTGAAAASTTSTPNITLDDNLEFRSFFRTVKWDGELTAHTVSTSDGSPSVEALWSARDKLQAKVGASSDSRVIFTSSGTSTVGKRDWVWTELTTTEKSWFENKCSGTGMLSQCVGLSSEHKAIANSGLNMLNYLRGQRGYEKYMVTAEYELEIFRQRDYVLADIASSRPAYVSVPKQNYSDLGYSSFKIANAERDGMVYVGSNGGMLHAFDATTGEERWAYVPRMVMPQLFQLASTGYGTNHRYFVDGSPVAADVQVTLAVNGVTKTEWRTILVGGLNKGGRGYYALDVTDPDDPKPLWEICHDSSLCPQQHDADLGFTYSEPIITRLPAGHENAGKWVILVSSGYNNVSPGTGKGYLFVLDAMTGAKIHKIDTGEGTTSDPIGLNKVADFVDDDDALISSSLAFAGDLKGNLWRFNLLNASVIKLARFTDNSGDPQPITTRPEIGQCKDKTMIYVGTGSYLGASDVQDTQLQTMWGVKDSTVALGALRNSDTMVQQLLSGTDGMYTASNNTVNLTTANGWFVNFDRNSGERVNLDPVLVNGNLVVVTNQPISDGSAACGTGGKGFLYQFSYCSGSYMPLPSAPKVGEEVSDSVLVGGTIVGLPSGIIKLKLTTSEGVQLAPITIGQIGGVGGPLRRISWRELIN